MSSHFTVIQWERIRFTHLFMLLSCESLLYFINEIFLLLEVPFFLSSWSIMMSSYYCTIKKYYPYLKNSFSLKLSKNFRPCTIFCPPLVSCVDSVPISLLFTIFIWESSPATSFFHNIEYSLYTFTKRYAWWFTWCRKVLSNHLELFICEMSMIRSFHSEIDRK